MTAPENVGRQQRQRVLVYLAGHGRSGAGAIEVSERTGIPLPAVHRALDALVAVELLERSPIGAYPRWRATATGRAGVKA